MKATFTLSVSAITLPDATCPSARAQKCRFCARKARKRGVEGKKRTKISILCSKRPKMWVLKGKSAQKPRFCARNARKQGFRRPKAHKNANFVLEMPENEGSRPQKRTKMLILCSGMVAASLAAHTGAQHCPPRALRGASGSSAPGNR